MAMIFSAVIKECKQRLIALMDNELVNQATITR